MAVITQTNGALSAIGPTAITRTTMTASDTFTYFPASGQRLVLFNSTASIVNLTLVGSAPVPVTPAGYGSSISTSAGIVVAVPASGTMFVDLDDIAAFLAGNGTVTATGGTGLIAHLYN